MITYKKLIFTLIVPSVVYFAYFHGNVALSYEKVPLKTNVEQMQVRIIREVTPRTIKGYAKEKTGDEWKAFDYIISHESTWKPKAQNPSSTAFGLGQFLNSTWAIVGCEKTTDAYKQIDCTIKYMEQRYGSITKAQVFWKINRWY